MMSVDFPGALPSWKLALIERKRRQDLDYRHPRGSSGKPGAEATSVMPPWKQELLSRKQQKRLAGAKGGHDGEGVPSLADILLSPEDSKKCGGMFDPWPTILSPVGNDSQGKGPSSAQGTGFEDVRGVPLEERLPPVHKNPILLMDMESRMPSGVSRDANGSQRSGLFAKLSRLGVSSHFSFDGDAATSSASKNSRYDEGFDEEEVIYGKGFVSRLLQKFSHLSGREEAFSSGPHFSRSLSRGQSNEDFLDGRYDCRPGSTRPPRRKSSSLDDLLKDNSSSRLVSENGEVNEDEGNCIWWPSQGGEGSMVVSVRNIFESLATSPMFAKDCTLHARCSTSPEWSEKPDVPDKIRNTELPIGATPNTCSDNVRKRSSSSKSLQEENSNVKITAQPRTIISDSSNFYERQASLLLPDDYEPAGVGFELISLGDVNDDGKINAQISSFKTEASVHSIANLPADNNLTTEKSGYELLKFEMSVGDSQIRQKNEGQISPNSLSKQSHSDCLESAERDASPDILFPPGQSAAAVKKTPPRPGLLLIRPASNLSNIKTDYLQMTKYNDIRHGDFVPAKKPAQRGAQVDDSDSDESEESADVSKYLDNVCFEFEGAGIRTGRSLLAKSKQGTQLKTCFDDAATVVFEYPSEQSLVDSWPPDIVDVDHSSGQDSDRAMISARLTSDTINLSADPSKAEVDLAPCVEAAGLTAVAPSINSQDTCAERVSEVSSEKTAFSGTEL